MSGESKIHESLQEYYNIITNFWKFIMNLEIDISENSYNNEKIFNYTSIINSMTIHDK